MPEQTMEAPKKVKGMAVGPWAIMADHPRNCDLLLVSLSNSRMRSFVKPIKTIFTREAGEQVQQPASAGMIQGLPSSIPGMELHVNPADGTFKIIDPLRGNEEQLEKIRRAINAAGAIRTDNKLRGIPDRVGKLDRDQMKTLVREMCRLVDAGEAVVCKGAQPSEDELENMPGEFLTNPTNMGGWHQPRYEKDMDSWTETLNRLR
ncbi:hypothetical protein M0R72_14290 [Candidatus Pacearchaeota archaeon]|jgi:hypothetical protein|nr:hypothetical protein [Candidatus Pacearchaeota archaeon]